MSLLAGKTSQTTREYTKLVFIDVNHDFAKEAMGLKWWLRYSVFINFQRKEDV